MRALRCLLALLPATALAVEGSASLELGGGNKTLILNAMGDISLVKDRLYLTTSYGLLKEADLPREGLVPGVTLNPVHVFQAGLDWSPSRHWLISAMVAGSPRATNTVTLDNNARLESMQASLQGFLAVMYQSANLDPVDWSLDATLLGGSNQLTAIEVGPLKTRTQVTPLLVARPALGLTLTVQGRLDLSARATYFAYSTDPTTAGDFLDLDKTFGQAALATSAALNRVNDFTGYASAPSWVEARAAVLFRFTPRLSGQLSYTYVRYVAGHGYAAIFSTRWSWKVHRLWRLWISGSLQYDDPIDYPATRTSAETQQPFISGLGTLGGEFTYGDSD
jgi:hypothetical protein